MLGNHEPKTIGAFIYALKLFSKYEREGMETKYFLEPGHDIIYGGSIDKITPETTDGQILEYLGWHVDSEFDCWAYFT